MSLQEAADAAQYAKDMKKVFESLPSEFALLDRVKGELQKMVVDAGGRAAAKVAAKAGIKQLAGSSLPVAGNLIALLWTVYDAAVAIGEVKEIKLVAAEALEKLEALKSRLAGMRKIAKGFDGLTSEEAHARTVDAQEMLATLNDCTRARKCVLVPFQNSGGEPYSLPKKMEPTKRGGCCNGQTGHHLVPEKSIPDSCVSKYKHKIAPTVCVEGGTQHFGSHKRAHRELAREHATLMSRGKVAADGTMSVDHALEAAAKSHMNAFPLSKCSEACIRAQLDNYYKNICSTGRFKMVNANSTPVKPGPAPQPAPQPQPTTQPQQPGTNRGPAI